MRFVNSIILDFTTAQRNEDNEFFIPPWVIEIKKKIVSCRNTLLFE